MNDPLSRDVPIDPQHAALLFVDMQNYTPRRDGGEYLDLSAPAIDERYDFYFETLQYSRAGKTWVAGSSPATGYYALSAAGRRSGSCRRRARDRGRWSTAGGAAATAQALPAR